MAYTGVIWTFFLFFEEEFGKFSWTVYFCGAGDESAGREIKRILSWSRSEKKFSDQAEVLAGMHTSSLSEAGRPKSLLSPPGGFVNVRMERRETCSFIGFYFY